MPYPYPNWIQPPDLAGEYARGAQLGLEQSRMQMQAEENQRAHLMEQQRLEVEKAYKDQQLAMQKQELDQATQLNKLKIQDAAQRMSAQKAYQDFVNAGGDPTEGMLKFGMQLGLDSSGFYNLAAKAAAAKHPFVPEEMTTPGGVHMVKRSPTAWEVIPENKVPKEDYAHKKELDDAYKELDEGRKAYDAATDPQTQANISVRIAHALGRIKAATTVVPKSRMPLTKELAKQFLAQAKGDKEKARQLAKDAGYDF